MTDHVPPPTPDQTLPTHAGDPAHPVPPAAFLPPAAAPPKRPTRLLVAVAGSVLGLLLLGGAATAVYSAAQPAAAPATGGPTAVPSNTASAPSPSAAATPKHLHFATPQTVGAWHQATDAGQAADKLAKGLADRGLTETFGAAYRDDASHTVLMYGGNSTQYGNGQETNQASSLARSIAKAITKTATTTQKPADPGPIGGVAACAHAGTDTPPETACVWVADNLVLALIFDGLSLDDATDQIHTMLPDLVVLT